MKKLVEDIQIGDKVFREGQTLSIVNTYEVNGEGVGFISTDEESKEQKFSATCGTFLTVLV